MFRFSKSIMLIMFAVLCLGVLHPLIASAEDPGIKGWGINSEYNSHYDINELDSFRGRYQGSFDVTPLPGMAPGVGILVEDQDGDMIKVQLGPKSFVNLDSIGLRKGDKVKVKGVWADINGEEVFMASKVKNKSRGDEEIELKVRLTSDGTPFWTMTPQQLAKERASQGD